jgi:mRNA-degrading endonuclease RelE of RelBE toxin-antitoxin system
MSETPYTLRVSAGVRRAFAERLPEAVVAAAYDFITGPLLLNPQRRGKPLRGGYDGYYSANLGSYRVIYVIDHEKQVVTVDAVRHRSEAYKTT